MTTPMTWPEHQQWEAAWWGTCANTFNEENKQILYANRMGLVDRGVDELGRWPSYDLAGATVIDIGGGPTSILLKCRGVGVGLVIDPCSYPAWVYDRYSAAGIGYRTQPGEDIPPTGVYDEAWLYNVLQHTEDPELIVANARAVSRLVRIFEWIDTPTGDGHPQSTSEDDLLRWLGLPTIDRGLHVETFTGAHGCYGPAFFGAFAQ